MRPLPFISLIVWMIALSVAFIWAIQRNKNRWLAQLGIGITAWLLLNVYVGFMPNDFGPASWADIQDGIMPDGYAEHSVETSISAQENWMIGETKDCVSAALTYKEAGQFGQEPGYVAASIACDNKGQDHRITVKLYGRLNQPEHFLIDWRCVRESEGFTCFQTGAE